MKKKIIYSSALAALLSASSIALAGGPEIIPVEDYFSGLYVGGTGSMHHADFDGTNNLFLDIPANTPIFGALFTPGNLVVNDINQGSIDGYGGIQGGFGWTFNHVWYLGVQGFGEFGSQSQTTTSTDVPVNVNILGLVSDTFTTTSATTVKISNDYGVAAKFGYVVAPRTLVYGKVGASWAELKISNSNTAVNDFNILPNFPLVNSHTVATAYSSNSDTKVGLLLGIGFEQFVYQDIVSVNVEYDYVNYGSVSTGPVQLTATTTGSINGVPITPNGPVNVPLTTSATASATVNSILGGINFYFGRNWF